jgi:hypothetical protein
LLPLICCERCKLGAKKCVDDKVKLPYLYFYLEILANLKMGTRVNAFDRKFNGIEDFVGRIRYFELEV